MRKNSIGMEHATVALTMEQAISSMLTDPNSMYSSISEILDTWIQCLQHVQPKPLTHLTLKSSSAFGSPLLLQRIPIMAPMAAQQQQEPTPSIVNTSTVQQQSKNVPSTPVSTMDASGSCGKPMSSRTTRSKASGRKSNNKTAIAMPPLSTITIATTPSTLSSHQRSRADYVTEAVSAKILTSSTTSVMEGESHQQHIIPTVSRGKPPLAPNNTNGLASASGAGIVTTTSLMNNSSSSGSKRTNMDSAVQESSSSGGGRPASPSSSSSLTTIPSSNNKRQRRSTSMSTSSDN